MSCTGGENETASPLAPSTAGHRDRPALVRFSVLECCAPYTGGSSSASDQFFLDDIGLRLTTHGSAVRECSHKRLHVGLPISVGRHSLMLRPSSLLALLTVRHRVAAPEDVLRSSFLPTRYLLGSRNTRPTGRLPGPDFHRQEKQPLSAAP